MSNQHAKNWEFVVVIRTENFRQANVKIRESFGKDFSNNNNPYIRYQNKMSEITSSLNRGNVKKKWNCKKFKPSKLRKLTSPKTERPRVIAEKLLSKLFQVPFSTVPGTAPPKSYLAEYVRELRRRQVKRSFLTRSKPFVTQSLLDCYSIYSCSRGRVFTVVKAMDRSCS